MTLKKKNWIGAMLLTFGMIGLLTFTSCQKEGLETNQEENTNTVDSSIFESGGLVGLTQGGRDEDGDGQADGFLENDFEIQYPIEVVFPDGTTTTVNSDDELFNLIEDWFEANDPVNEEDFPTLVFPISVTLEDGTVETINSEEELEDLIKEYFEYDEFDEDYEDYEDFEDISLDDLIKECFTIEYPITIVLPDSSATVNNLEEAEMILEAYYEANGEEGEHPTFAYPINVTFEDGTTDVINDEDEFEDLVEDCLGYSDCDKDDDCDDDEDDDEEGDDDDG